ncbi:hypothetical protein, partial [Thiocapsa sp.]|uniref:hypothetical protein n=1 Tax=Thiocapsa sp. TaxID=2024551 RepID=UPI002CB91DFD
MRTDLTRNGRLARSVHPEDGCQPARRTTLVAEIDRRIAEEIDLPPGYSVVFGGQFENQQRAQQRLMIVVPLSLG